jgi:yecA family protein
MKPKARHTTRYGHEAPTLLPPDLNGIGPLAFETADFRLLDAWLAESGWPEGHMGIAMLEGYLVALLVWPIELPPGAWLPRIWGIRGWKVAAKIATPELYHRFVRLVIGLYQELERRLAISPPDRTFVLGTHDPCLSDSYFAGAAWSTGFLTALHENSRGLASRSASVRSAVEQIAHFAPLRSSDLSTLPLASTALSLAVMNIMSERPVRGPGAFATLDKSAPTKSSATGRTNPQSVLSPPTAL